MGERGSFYIELTSAVTSRTEETNTNTDFTTPLPSRLELDGSRAQVGVKKIHFPNSWFNIIQSEFVITRPPPSQPFTISVVKAKYNTIKDFLDDVAREMQRRSVGGKVKFYHDVSRARVFLQVAANHSVKLNAEMATSLGLIAEKEYGRNEDSIYVSKNSPNINRGFTSLYVYSDIVQPRIVGDVKVPLLRNVPIGTVAPSKENVYMEFSKPDYIPAAHVNTESVTVVIRRDDGTPVPFTHGKVELTLHIKS